MFIEELRARLPAEALVTDPAVTLGYARDQASWAPSGTPVAVVRPGITAEVLEVVRACASHGVALVPRGAGTGLAGGANAPDGAVVLSTERMDRILRVDAAERLAVVQPGVVNDVLRAACAAEGLWYPPDPASAQWSTIGGNIATNAGGLCCVKYGVTRDYVLGLEVVDGSGDVLHLGRRTAKGVAGLDLTGLMVGSEGTLGVITEATVRLRPARGPEHTVAAGFSSLREAGEAVAAVRSAGLTPSALELLDRVALGAVHSWKRTGMESDVLLMGRTDAAGPAGDAEAEVMLGCFETGALWAGRSSDSREAEELFAIRRLCYPAVERLGDVLTEDVCVPVGQLPLVLERIEDVARRHEITIAMIAHAGDGNLHPLLVTPRGDRAARARAQSAFDEIVDAALRFGGTITGEHGVGLLKRDGLRTELSPAVLAVHQRIKRALDPQGIMNPGKVVDLSPRPSV